MKRSVVYHLPIDRWQDVPTMIEKAAGTFFEKGDFVALKIHFGEKGNRGYVRPEWVRPVVDMVKGKGAYPYLTDTNTIYRGQRADSIRHLTVANGHGFKIEKVGAPIIIADGIRGADFSGVEIDGKHFKSVKIANGILEADAMIILSHTKGHILTGFGGAIKNLGMGCAAKSGKYEMHASLAPRIVEEKCIGCGRCIKCCAQNALALVNMKVVLDAEKCVGCGECLQACSTSALEIPWDMPSQNVQERLVEYAVGAAKGKRICCVNYMHRITKYCDCFSSDKNEMVLDNLGILVSTDPVAIDQASVDIINKAAGRDILMEMNDKDYTIQFLYAEEMGLGSRKYDLY